MPNPPDGLAWLVEEDIAPSGEVTRKLQARLPDLGQDEDRERDLAVHYTLSGGFTDPNHSRLIVVDKPIRLEAPSLFTFFEVLILNNVSAFIALDKDASPNPGAYDRRHPGSALDDGVCLPAKLFSIVFQVVPPDPVEVHLYGGKFADRKR